VGGDVAGEIVRVAGVDQVIDGDASAAPAAAAEQFALAAIGGDESVAAHGPRVDPDAAARTTARTVLKTGKAIGAEPTVHSECAADVQSNRAAAPRTAVER